MKNLIYTLVLCLVSNLVLAQTQTENYVKTTTPQVEVQNSTNLNALNADDKIESITYFDGLGRPIQSIAKQAGGQRQDIITPIVYDAFGRQVKDYLPYARANSSLDYELPANLMINLNNQYINKYADDLDAALPNPFSEKVLEASPLNRVLEQAAPGKDWAVGNGHTIKLDYQTNKANEVKLFSVNHPGGDTEKTELVFDGYYHAGELYKTITKDENWTTTSGKNHTTEEFKNKRGQVVLKRTYSGSLSEVEVHDTQYVYDDFGNLTYVLPPTGSDEIVIEQTNNQSVSQFFSWEELINVDARLAETNNRKLKDYKAVNIKSTDLNNEYSGQGGFTVFTDSSGEVLYLDINFSATSPVELKKGLLIKLEELGKFTDTELGSLNGETYNYIIYIKDNSIYIEGEGELTGLTETYSNTTTLEYNQDYLWSKYMDVNPKFVSGYERQITQYAQETGQDPLHVYLENEYGGQGGVSISIDNQDNISLSFNSNTEAPLSLRQGAALPLNIRRMLANRNLGTISGEGYAYNFSLVDNTIVISGEGAVTSFSGFLSASTTPPQTTFTIVPEVIEGLGYIYHYDYRNRLIEKKIPGKGWEYIVYDKLDRPILTQDAKQRLDNKWLYTKYDAFGRVAYTGEYTENTTANSRLNIQEAVNTHTSLNETRQSTAITLDNTALHYSNDAFPNASNLKLYTINYYDDYQGLDITSTDFVKQDGDIVLGQSISMQTKTLPTISKVRILETNQWTTSVSYYNDRAQAIYVASKNDYLNATDIVTSKLDFTGRVLEARTEHTKGASATIFTTDMFSYDHTGRLLTQLQSINGGTQEKIVNNNYDELGQLVSKHVGGTSAGSGLQTVDYNYNIRGWLKTINNGLTNNDDLFGFKINYNTPEHAGVTPLYNGNISETHWQTANDNKTRSYDYRYDALNRIKDANYHGDYGLFNNLTELEDYSISNINYDKNGNINSLTRLGLVTANNTIDIIDNLNYVYAPLSNKLTAVNDTASEDGFKDANANTNDYEYDINGNMTVDNNKHIAAITYNHLNLPTSITIQNNNGNDFDDGTIAYVYDATGVKLSKTVTTGNLLVIHGSTTTQYSGNYIYADGSHSPMTLKFFSTPEGYVEPQLDSSYTITGFNYVYQYKDHLGNIRLTYADSDNNGSIDASTEIISEKNYYPFGLEHKGYNNIVSANSNSVAQKFKYHGKEIQDELGLNWYDFSARNYDAALGRWMNLDPLTEAMRRHSPYNFAFDNPIYFQDPDGMMPCPTGDCPDPPNGNGMNQMNRGNSAAPVGDSSNPSSSHSRGSVGSSQVTGSDVVRSVAAEGAYTGIQSERVRNQYNNTASKLSPTDSEGRIKAREKLRAETPSVTKAVLDKKRPLSNEKTKTTPTANKTNTKVNNQAKLLGKVGKGVAVVGVVASANNIANAENKVEAVATEAGAWGGAIAGGEILGTAGATFGPWGAGIGVVVGSIVGGIAGEEAVEAIINAPPVDRTGPGYCNCRWDYTCFVAGTKVLMSDGTEKNIEEIKEGDKILSVDVSTMTIEEDLVLVIPNQVKKYRKIIAKFDNGTINKFSPAHPYYVKSKGWAVYDLKEAKKELNFKVAKLEVGDEVYYYENNQLIQTTLKSLEDTGEYVEMYNVENVKKNHTFFANKVLVHNKYLAKE